MRSLEVVASCWTLEDRVVCCFSPDLDQGRRLTLAVAHFLRERQARASIEWSVLHLTNAQTERILREKRWRRKPLHLLHAHRVRRERPVLGTGN